MLLCFGFMLMFYTRDSLESGDDEKPKVRHAIQERFQVKDVPEFLTKLASRHPLPSTITD